MKLATVALVSAFALASTFALAHTTHHKYKSGVKTHYTAHPKSYRSYGRYRGNPNDRGGLVGGSDPGTYRP